MQFDPHSDECQFNNYRCFRPYRLCADCERLKALLFKRLEVEHEEDQLRASSLRRQELEEARAEGYAALGNVIAQNPRTSLGLAAGFLGIMGIAAALEDRPKKQSRPAPVSRTIKMQPSKGRK